MMSIYMYVNLYVFLYTWLALGVYNLQFPSFFNFFLLPASVNFEWDALTPIPM